MNKELIPYYDTRNSFGGKALIRDIGSEIQLYSYGTLVCDYDTDSGTVKVYGWFSVSTAIHINEFLKQRGFCELSKSEMEKKPFIERKL